MEQSVLLFAKRITYLLPLLFESYINVERMDGKIQINLIWSVNTVVSKTLLVISNVA